MYCQTCGAEVQTELNYCNRCGALVNSSLATQQQQEPAAVDIKSPVRTLGATITLTTLIGFLILFFSLAGLASAERPLPATLLGILSVAGLLLILIIDVMLIRIMSRLVQHPVATTPALKPQPGRPAPRELHTPAAQTYISASTDPLPVGSVTDHTTRTFHPIYKEPRADG